MKNARSTKKLLITTTEACKMLGISRTMMYRLIHEGIIPAVRFPNCRKLYLSVEALKQMILDNMSSSSEIGGEENE